MKVNVSNLAFFFLGWTPESSQMQTRYNGLKMPFPAFRISSPLHSFFPSVYLPDALIFSSQLTPYLYSDAPVSKKYAIFARCEKKGTPYPKPHPRG
jgi:hypothetical protein